MTGVVLSHRGSAVRATTAERTTDSLGLAFEGISALLTAAEGATLLLELGHGDGREGGGGVVFCLVVVDFVDGVGRVDDGGLDGLLLDDGLDVLVDVVVDVFACDDSLVAGGVFGFTDGALVFELSSLGLKTLVYVVIIAVLDVSVLDAGHVMAVLFW